MDQSLPGHAVGLPNYGGDAKLMGFRHGSTELMEFRFLGVFVCSMCEVLSTLYSVMVSLPVDSQVPYVHPSLSSSNRERKGNPQI